MYSTVIINESEFRSNQASNSGGCLYISSLSVTISEREVFTSEEQFILFVNSNDL